MTAADADACVHQLYASGGAAVEHVSEACPGTKAADGSVDRSALSKAVVQLGRELALRQLEEIVHPLVLADREDFISQAAADGEWLVVLDVPLLLENHQVQTLPGKHCASA